MYEVLRFGGPVGCGYLVCPASVSVHAGGGKDAERGSIIRYNIDKLLKINEFDEGFGEEAADVRRNYSVREIRFEKGKEIWKWSFAGAVVKKYM